MQKKISYIQILFLLLFSTSCENLFHDERKKPLEGERINVLHSDTNDLAPRDQTNSIIVKQTNILAWPTSDVNKSLFIPDNLSLPNNIKFADSFYLNLFNNRSLSSSYIIVEDKVVSYKHGILSTYSLINKKKLWSKILLNSNEKNNILDGAISYKDGLIYIATGSFKLVVCNLENGSEVWQQNLSNAVRSIPYIDQNNVYTLTIDNKIYCFDRKTGNLNWHHEGTSFNFNSTKNYQPFITFEDKLIVATGSGELLFINKISGEELANFNYTYESIIGDGSLAKQPISSLNITGEDLIFLSGEETVVNFNLHSLTFNWIKKFHNAKSLWTTKDTSFILTNENFLLSFDNKSGNKIWIKDLGKDLQSKNKLKLLGPIYAGDHLIICASNGVFWTISPNDGGVVNRYNVGFALLQIPYVVNQKLYFFGSNGKLSIWH